MESLSFHSRTPETIWTSTGAAKTAGTVTTTDTELIHNHLQQPNPSHE